MDEAKEEAMSMDSEQEPKELTPEQQELVDEATRRLLGMGPPLSDDPEDSEPVAA